MKPRLYFHAGVPPDLRRRLTRLRDHLAASIDVRHAVRISVTASPAVSCNEATALGTFDPWTLRVTLAGDVAGIAAWQHLSRRRAVALVGESLAHELVHYEQWRDGRPLVEQGVDRRARGLLRRAKGEGRRGKGANDE